MKNHDNLDSDKKKESLKDRRLTDRTKKQLNVRSKAAYLSAAAAGLIALLAVGFTVFAFSTGAIYRIVDTPQDAAASTTLYVDSSSDQTDTSSNVQDADVIVEDETIESTEGSTVVEDTVEVETPDSDESNADPSSDAESVVSTTEGQTHNETSPASTWTYVIVWGDTLSELAETYGTTVAELAAINHIENVDLIYANDTLQIPVD